MSWFNDIAGKAEHLLNKLDQNAAVVLSNVNDKSGFKKSRSITSGNNSRDNLSIEQIKVESESPDVSITWNPKESTRNFSSLNSSTQVSKLILSNTTEDIAHTKKPKETNHNFNKSKSILQQKPKAVTDEDLLSILNSTEDDKDNLNETLILKTELTSQSNEMGLLIKKNNKLQHDYEELKQLYDILRNQQSISSQNRETQAEPVSVDDSNSINTALNELVEEKNKEVLLLTEKLDSALNKLRSSNEVQEIKRRLDYVEQENQRLQKLNLELNEKSNESAKEQEKLREQIQMLRDSLSEVEKEYTSYKNKAKNILKSKDEVILSLKNKKECNNESLEDKDSETYLSDDNQFQLELNSWRNERELLQVEITQMTLQIETLKEENVRSENELLSLRSINFDLQNIVSKERQRVRNAQEENLQLSHTIATLQLEIEKEKLDKKKLIEKHRRTPSNPLTRSSSSSDFQFQTNSSRQSPIPFPNDISSEEIGKLKTRIAALSQSLFEKQSLVNELCSDKQMLQIKNERLETELEDVKSASNYCMDGHSITTVVSNQPLYLTESPWDSSVSLRVKKIYHRLDSLCCQIGVVLRHRPTLRLGFVAYVLILHIWVFFVLFFWTHEATTF